MSRRPPLARRGRLVLVPAGDQTAPPAPPAPAPPVLLRVLLGRRLRRARQAQARTLRDVAAVAGVSIGHLSQVERGLAEASSEVLAALCRALGVPLHVLLRAAAVDLTTTAAPSERSVVSLSAVRPAVRPADRTTSRSTAGPGRRSGDGVQALAA